jgi:hypothetical protein
MTTIQTNRTVGRAFQELVQRSMQYPQENGYAFESPARAAATQRLSKPIGRVRPARVLFITTSDTSAGPADTLSEATSKGVSIWKAIVCRDPGKNSFQVGPPVSLNPAVFQSNTLLQ